ncbi:hypothetical protein IFR05_017425, partial [Cadophora sp. M221]
MTMKARTFFPLPRIYPQQERTISTKLTSPATVQQPKLMDRGAVIQMDRTMWFDHINYALGVILKDLLNSSTASLTLRMNP